MLKKLKYGTKWQKFYSNRKKVKELSKKFYSNRKKLKYERSFTSYPGNNEI